MTRTKIKSPTITFATVAAITVLRGLTIELVEIGAVLDALRKWTKATFKKQMTMTKYHVMKIHFLSKLSHSKWLQWFVKLPEIVKWVIFVFVLYVAVALFAIKVFA